MIYNIGHNNEIIMLIFPKMMRKYISSYFVPTILDKSHKFGESHIKMTPIPQILKRLNIMTMEGQPCMYRHSLYGTA